MNPSVKTGLVRLQDVSMYGLHANAACGCKAGASLWIEVWFGDCIYSTWEMIAFYIGLSSLMFWLVAQVPQFISNWRLQSADALSPWFLLQWLAVSTPLPFAVSSLGFWNWSDTLRQTYDLHGLHCSRVIFTVDPIPSSLEGRRNGISIFALGSKFSRIHMSLQCQSTECCNQFLE